MPDPIVISINPDWVDPTTKDSCKYSPVVVPKVQTPGAILAMQEALKTRISTCKSLASIIQDVRLPDTSWFSFLRAGPSHEPHLRPSNVPVIVISGGSARKLAADLSSSYSLAWHPINLRSEPLYLLVHKLDFNNYARAMAGIMSQFRNMHLIGWDGSGMTGFGAARAAALAFADTLPYRPKRILMMDQDVIQTETTRHTNPEVHTNLLNKHATKPIVGLGVGYPTRVPAPGRITNKGKTIDGFHVTFGQESRPEGLTDFNSPAQQFVSILAPFRSRAPRKVHPRTQETTQAKKDDGMYPSYMVAGGEDMLMGMQLGLTEDDINTALLNAKIQKKALSGAPDPTNEYWNGARVTTLARLYDIEKSTVLFLDDTKKQMTLDEFLTLLQTNGLIKSHPSAESYNVSACVIERIILRLHKLGRFPVEVDSTVFDR